MCQNQRLSVPIILCHKRCSSGLILGPLFFLVMINDLPRVCKNSTSFLYTDDAKFLRIGTLNADFQKDLKNIFTWTQQNQIAFNESKCTHLPVKRATSCEFYFDSILIKKVSEEKDLRIIVKSDLGWTSHIKLRRGRTFSTLCMPKRNPLPLNTKIKLNLFKSMVIPVFLYGSACYQLNVEEMKLLEGVQRNACKWIATDPIYKPSLQRLGILPLPMIFSSIIYFYYLKSPIITTNSIFLTVFRQKLT